MVFLMPGDIPMTENTLRGLQIQIDSLGTRMEKGFDEVKEMLNNTNERLRCVELQAANQTPNFINKIDSAWEKIKSHEEDIKHLKKTVDELMQTNKILKWILGVMTVLMTAYLVKLLLGG